MFTKDIVLPHLVHVYNYVMDMGDYPDQWAGLRIVLPKDNGADVRLITITIFSRTHVDP